MLRREEREECSDQREACLWKMKSKRELSRLKTKRGLGTVRALKRKG
jgi:hypothetical protein